MGFPKSLPHQNGPEENAIKNITQRIIEKLNL